MKVRRGIVFAFSFLTYLDSKTLLLKTPHTLTARHREIILELNWKLFSYWLAYILPKGATQAAGRENTFTQVETLYAAMLTCHAIHAY